MATMKARRREGEVGVESERITIEDESGIAELGRGEMTSTFRARDGCYSTAMTKTWIYFDLISAIFIQQKYDGDVETCQNYMKSA